MTERPHFYDQSIIPKHEQDYWDTWADALPFPKGVVQDAKSYTKAVKEKQEEKKK